MRVKRMLVNALFVLMVIGVIASVVTIFLVFGAVYEGYTQ